MDFSPSANVMTRQPGKLGWLVGAFGVAVVVGCGGGGEPLVQTAAPAPAESAPEKTEPEPPTEDKPPAPEVMRSVYRPPFPGRTNLFAPMQKKRVARSDDDSGESVVLKGFADVEEPMAVLAIDGRVISLGAGAERYGVQVISIEPPEVVLQRGRSRWTATLQ